MKWLSRLFGPKKCWRLVQTFKYDNGISRGREGDPNYKSGDMYYYLFESDAGDRKIKVRCTIQDVDQPKLEEFAVSTDFYHEKLYRWLVGRGDPEIQRYDEVDQEETMHQLKGTIEETI
jgi:hypothetical protein